MHNFTPSHIYTTLKIKIFRKYFQLTSNIRRKKIKNKNFTIISNNCWGGFVYQSYGLKYRTPTIGLFFMADDYIKFVYNLDEYLAIDNIVPISIDASRYSEYLKEKSYHGVIGKLNDIEIMFMHYNSIEEAIKKWNERKKRINKNNILFKFCEQNQCKETHIKKFLDLPAKNKICFITNKHKQITDQNLYRLKTPEIDITNEPLGNSRIANINYLIDSLIKQ